MKTYVASAVALAALIVGMGAARAEDNLQTLEGFRQTAPMDWPTIPQTGPRADAIKEILKKITLPQGFHIDLYAIVPDARHMAVGPQGVVTFVGTRKNKIWAVTDRDRSGGGEGVEVKEFAPSLAEAAAERPLLLEGRLPLCRRAEPGPSISGGRILLRGPGRGGRRRRSRRAS